ncbi:MAG TPA: ATP-binding protein [Polyangiaceae bacterium]|nr:ATP-binding protein [Polyangiaceae bacterium]
MNVHPTLGAFISFDDRSRILEVNEACCRLLGYTREELVGRSFNDVLAPSSRLFVQTHVLPMLARIQRFDEAYISVRTRSGEQVPVLLSASRQAPEEGGECHCLFLPMHRRQLFERELLAAQAAAAEARRAEHAALERIQAMQEKLALQERLATVGTLAAGMAHEINNPLGYVATNLQLVEEALRGGVAELDANAMRSMIRDAAEGAERIAKLVRSFKTYSRVELASNAPVDLAHVIDVSVRMTVHEIKARARLELQVTEQPTLVSGDEVRLSQVVVNLLVNAAQAFPRAMPANNQIWLRLDTEADQRVLLEVADNGPGIPRELQERIFEPFFTTKPVGQGTGLGLAICRDIVHSLNGNLSLESEPGRGTRFQIRLPITARGARAPTPLPTGQAE